jgi:EAL domain-containing protein (putative c-di-GMP-specific phosphodiesterase class I)
VSVAVSSHPAQPAPKPSVSLATALQNGWVEFWYQPKIDLRRKHLAGAEAFARVRTPNNAVLTPGDFLRGADARSLAELTELAVVNACQVSSRATKLGAPLRISVNVCLASLKKVPIPAIVRKHRPASDKWPGLVFDVTEDQVLKNVALMSEVTEKLAPLGIGFAIDDFGTCLSSQLQIENARVFQANLGKAFQALAEIKTISVAEVKLERVVVMDCSSDPRNASICKSVIDLAHHFGCLAVAMGLEQPSDVAALQAMGCDIGQGFIFGLPVMQDEFVASLYRRNKQ